MVLLAGTNGKGSTGAFLAHALQAAGFARGWTTSPHLVVSRSASGWTAHPREERLWTACWARPSPPRPSLGIQATYFELMITAAFAAFRETGVEVAVVEVGMGGRWDATNATDPLLTVLTKVGLDHQQYLGDTREASCSAMLNDITGSFAGVMPAAAICLKNATLLSPLRVLKIICGFGALDLADYRAEIGAAEGNVFFTGNHSLAVDDVLFENQVRGPRKHIVGAQQENLLVSLLEGPIERRQYLLVRLRAGIHDVGRTFVALELNWIPE